MFGETIPLTVAGLSFDVPVAEMIACGLGEHSECVLDPTPQKGTEEFHVPQTQHLQISGMPYSSNLDALTYSSNLRRELSFMDPDDWVQFGSPRNIQVIMFNHTCRRVTDPPSFCMFPKVWMADKAYAFKIVTTDLLVLLGTAIVRLLDVTSGEFCREFTRYPTGMFLRRILPDQDSHPITIIFQSLPDHAKSHQFRLEFAFGCDTVLCSPTFSVMEP